MEKFNELNLLSKFYLQVVQLISRSHYKFYRAGDIQYFEFLNSHFRFSYRLREIRIRDESLSNQALDHSHAAP